MQWVDPLRPLVQTPVGGFVLGVLLLVFGSTAVLSERTAREKFGAIGLLARWWDARKERAADAEERLMERQTRALWDEIARVDGLRMRDREFFEEQVARLEAVEKQQHRYIVWVTDMFRRVEIWAADHGYTLPPPPFKTFVEWVREVDKRE